MDRTENIPENAVHRRLEYLPPAYGVRDIVVSVQIDADEEGSLVTVTAELDVQRQHGGPGTPFVLQGRDLDLVSIAIDGKPLALETLQRDEQSLTLCPDAERFRLGTVVRLRPDRNQSLEGFYRSGDMLCTQCEAHGFSRITYFPDRPDVLSRYRVRLEGDAQRYPLLLSNGERVESGALEGGRHYAVWVDPFPKPCYLFAMVAGDLATVTDTFRTASGREVQLLFHVDHGNEGRVDHAIDSLKRAMAWDERVYGLECDLSTYQVVAARDFNMGAMENKGLNLFNARYALASAETATDTDFANVESVIAHEYFHNWTGNRVTCRDWFQLSLKEGLTVFRDQCFSADMQSPDVQRIGEVRTLRTVQFAEDAGPMAHPVRPEEYVEVNNFYTATVYEKGAEIIRMLRTLVGDDTFIRGVQHYLKKHDGTAATIEDFVTAHEEISGRSLQAFGRWYSQIGTPVVAVWDEYDLASGDYTLRFQQRPPTVGGQMQPLPIPLRFALWGEQAVPLMADCDHPALIRPDLLLLDSEALSITFRGLSQRPTPSLLRGFSAPIKLQYGYSTAQLIHLMLAETDGFSRWEAAQRLLLNAFFELLSGDSGAETEALMRALQALAANPPEDRALLAEMLRLPSEGYLASLVSPLDAQRLVGARDLLRQEIARSLTGPLSVWAGWQSEEQGAQPAGRRSLSSLSLWYLSTLQTPSVLDLCLERSRSANMTVAFSALQALNDIDCAQRVEAMDAFRQRWSGDALVMDKWFAVQAASSLPDGVERVQALLADPDYVPTPNRVRSVLSTFWRENLRAFHQPDGAGYALLADQIGELDRHNPQLASRLVDGLLSWRGCSQPARGLMRDALEKLSRLRLSPDVGEKVGKALT